ncbi:uncharacterized protein LOC109829931 isoform X2 [Asparagus officinalis]|uniref:uncharacterized protein LOC109829931 isoform X2 n=1 Tax=Asparagus officinalis TaxID=4686 RepID=UPI00098E3AF8|nr:uncharacterized protein LOC109829931 isoform X2 [Asparagus officinalis]
MPLTDQEKELRVHSRSSTDFLAAVPIKKRRFLFRRSPSPPPELPSPVLGDCSIPDNKPESPGFGLPHSRTEGNSVQVNTVTGKVAACKSCDQATDPPSPTPANSVPPNDKLESSEHVSTLNTGDRADFFSKEAQADCSTSDKKADSSKSVSCLPESGKVNVQLRATKGEVSSCEPSELSLTQADCVLPESKPDATKSGSPFLKIGGTTAKVNAETGEHACEPSVLSLPKPTGCGISEKNFASVKLPISKSRCDPAQVNSVTGNDGLIEPCEKAKPTDCGISEKDFVSLKPESPISKSTGDPAQVGSVTGKDGLIGPCEKSNTRDLNIIPKFEMLPNCNDQGSGLYLGANSVDETANTQDMVFSNKCATLPVTGSTVISSAAKQTFVVPRGQGNAEGKVTHREGISFKQGLELKNVESESRNAKIKADSGILYLNRSNWDLNTMMDTWVDSSADSLLNNETGDQDRLVLGGIQQRGRKQMLFREHNGTDIISGSSVRHKVDSNPEASLELQLKPPSLPDPCISLGKHEAITDKSFLSLATKPMMSTISPPLDIGTTIKLEPIEKDQKETAMVQLGLLKSLDLKPVKSESCGEEISKTTISSNLNLACSKSVKPEPPTERPENQSQVNARNSEHMGLKSSPENTLVHQNAGKYNNKALNLASKPLVLNTLLRPCTNFSNDSSSIANKVNQAPSSADCIPTFTSSTQVTSITAIESSALMTRLNEMNLSPEALLSDPLTSNTSKTGENIPAEGEFSFASQKDPSNMHHLSNDSQKDPSNVHHLSNDTSAEDILKKPCVTSEIIESDEVLDKVGVSSEVLEEHRDKTSKSGNLHVSEESMNTTPKQGGKSDEDFEDGEVRDPALKKTVEGSCDLAQEQSLKASDSISPVDVPVSMPLPSVEKEIKLESPKEENVCGSKESENGLLDDKIESCSSDVGVPTTDFCDKSLSKTTGKTLGDHLKNDESIEKEIKSSDLSSLTNLADSQSDAAGGQQNAEGPELAKDHVSGKAEPSDKGSVTKVANDRGNNRRIIYLNPASNCSASGKRKSTLDRSMSSQGERERPVDRSYGVERSRSRGHGNERPRRLGHERNYGRPFEKCNVHIRNRANRLNAMCGDRNSNVDQLLDQMNTSTGIRYSRPINNDEVSIDGSLDGSSRLRRKLTSEEMEDLSHLQCQRRSFEGRVPMPLVRRPTGREVPDFVSLSNPRSHFERAEGIVIRRERRSLSPTMRSLSPTLRRGGPQSSPGSQQRRPSDVFSRTREFMQHRSPPIMRLSRRQSPQERRCFPEERIVRRRGPPYDIVDVGPPREEFPRNTRRFNMADPRGITEEEDYFDLREFDDRFVDNRRCIDRRGPIRSFRQHCVDNDGSESFRFRGEAPPSRVLRMHTDGNDGFTEDSGPSRDFDVRFRNRLGNSSNRLRGIVEEQEDNYRHHGEQQEWRDSGFNNARPKRRRF